MQSLLFVVILKGQAHFTLSEIETIMSFSPVFQQIYMEYDKDCDWLISFEFVDCFRYWKEQLYSSLKASLFNDSFRLNHICFFHSIHFYFQTNINTILLNNLYGEDRELQIWREVNISRWREGWMNILWLEGRREKEEERMVRRMKIGSWIEVVVWIMRVNRV